MKVVKKVSSANRNHHGLKISNNTNELLCPYIITTTPPAAREPSSFMN